ncbi:hypothetical protein VKT23_009833 [Stygiomarasmius scandens]|uniref:Uncharacterized protein n=1 Tax=Marasmiellus scandens TaxID=2682957 RepID=A0ABR1IQ08_9AGAR
MHGSRTDRGSAIPSTRGEWIGRRDEFLVLLRVIASWMDAWLAIHLAFLLYTRGGKSGTRVRLHVVPYLLDAQRLNLDVHELQRSSSGSGLSSIRKQGQHEDLCLRHSISA